MAKWHGVIGCIVTEETAPGVWMPSIIERKYYGDILRNSNRWTNAQNSTNDNITLSMQISIVADPFANQNCHSMKYVEFMGTKWKITSIEVQFPRLILSIGGVYNGEQA